MGNGTVDLAALELLCDKLECGDANHRATAEQIRKAINGAKPQPTDTQEAIDADAAKRPCQYFGAQECRECPQGYADGSDIDYDECCTAQIRDLLERQRKLMGGE